MPDLDLSTVLLYLSYEPNSGRVTWTQRRGKAIPGKQAGTLDKDGYLQAVVLGRPVKVHRLAWFMHFGVWPDGEIDHINGCRTDNKISNLRVVSRMRNCQNLHKLAKNETGFPGVAKQSTGKFGAKVKFDNKSFWLGTFDTAEDASAAYKVARACSTREELEAIRDTYRAKLKAMK